MCLPVPVSSLPWNLPGLPTVAAGGGDQRWARLKAEPVQRYGEGQPSPSSVTSDAKTPPALGGTGPGKANAAGKAPARKKTRPEDQPFAEFVPKLLIPAMAQACATHGGATPTLKLQEAAMPVVGGSCWRIEGELPGPRRFWLCFEKPDINSRKTFALAESGQEPSLLEPFLIDEKRMSLPLLVARLVQRLDGQKWLGPN